MKAIRQSMAAVRSVGHHNVGCRTGGELCAIGPRAGGALTSASPAGGRSAVIATADNVP
jgi:hypothetical protein